MTTSYGANLLKVTSWIIGTSIGCCALTSYVFLLYGEYAEIGVIAVFFSFLLPAVVQDKRKYLRSVWACFLWLLILCIVMCIYAQANKIGVYIGLSCSLTISILLWYVNRIIPIKRVRTIHDMATIKVGSNKLITVGYYSVISGVYAFTLLGIGIYNMMAYAILLFSVISGAYTVYYWKWNIKLTDRGTIIIQSGRNNYHIKMDNVKEVIRVPLFGYWVISNEGNILFHFSLTMDNISKLWLFLRGKVK